MNPAPPVTRETAIARHGNSLFEVAEPCDTAPVSRLGSLTVLVFLGALALGGCFVDRSGTTAECTSDRDCVLDRVCVDGRCVERTDGDLPDAPDTSPPIDTEPPTDADTSVDVDPPIDTNPDAGFDPSHIPGLIVWFRASSLTSVEVTAWPNEGSLGGNARQNGDGVATATATRGVQVVRFDGDAHFVLTPFGFPEAGASVFIVAEIEAGLRNPHLLGYETGNDRLRVYSSNDAGKVFVRGGGTVELGMITGGFRLIELFDDGMMTEALVDGMTRGTTGSVSDGGGAAPMLTIGRSKDDDNSDRALHGDVAEVLIFDHPLDPAEQMMIRDYLTMTYAALLPPP